VDILTYSALTPASCFSLLYWQSSVLIGGLYNLLALRNFQRGSGCCYKLAAALVLSGTTDCWCFSHVRVRVSRPWVRPLCHDARTLKSICMVSLATVAFSRYAFVNTLKRII